MRRVRLWLRRSDGRADDPEYYIRDFADLDDRYQRERFNNRTFSEQDKFEDGVFLTLDEWQSFQREQVKALAEKYKGSLGYLKDK